MFPHPKTILIPLWLSENWELHQVACRETQMICDLIHQTTGMWKREHCIVHLSFLSGPHGVCFVARAFLVFVCTGAVRWDSALGQRLYWSRNCTIRDRPWKESGRKAPREEALRAHAVLAPRPNTLYNIQQWPGTLHWNITDMLNKVIAMLQDELRYKVA